MKHFRFKSVVKLANMKLSVKSAAIVLASSTLVSALLGLFRDRLLNSYYLGTYPTGIDAYTAAFTIPDFMFFILTSGALSVSFIPVFNQRLASGNKKSAWELSSSLLNLFAILTFVTSILIMIFADPLIRYIVSPGLDESGMILAINMTRVIAINPFLFSIATVLTSIQQAVGRFVFYAFAPAIYNVGIIIGITCFTGGINIFGVQIFEGGIMGVALGVILGAIMQLIVSLVGLFGLGMDYNFKINWKNQGFRSILRLLPARSLDQGIDYVNGIVNTNLSSRMGAGAVRSFNQASSLHQMPVNLIGVAISTAFFPKLTEELGNGDKKEFNSTFRQALRTIIWIALPVSIIAFFGRGYVTSFISNIGNNDSNGTIASILGTLCIAIFARSVFHIASRGFYAYQDTKTPFVVSIFAIGLTILLSVWFYFLGWGVDGLGMAQSLGAIVEIVVLMYILQRRSKGELLDKAFWKATFRMLFATAITGCVAFSMTKFIPLMATDNSLVITIPKFLVISAISIIAYLVASYFLNLKEAKPIFAYIKRILFRNAK
ncbi:MAG: murein biosynthesis integral membrane protein MurJ [Candidatus Saccharibacteria bacterium]|nr:murein biosynthesis integral membrane protein MurJ [Candidatus Nanosyncoccus alces]MBQ2643607.1 murein biosynthesis integral membrane protein MurJ [Candidatus Saccharibacteria bacterium]MDO4398863.1 murein biosynthesis integral membrane protein MurJ [Candidatus Saccharibacteria bacterium]